MMMIPLLYASCRITLLFASFYSSPHVFSTHRTHHHHRHRHLKDVQPQNFLHNPYLLVARLSRRIVYFSFVLSRVSYLPSAFHRSPSAHYTGAL